MSSTGRMFVEATWIGGVVNIYDLFMNIHELLPRPNPTFALGLANACG